MATSDKERLKEAESEIDYLENQVKGLEKRCLVLLEVYYAVREDVLTIGAGTRLRRALKAANKVLGA